MLKSNYNRRTMITETNEARDYVCDYIYTTIIEGYMVCGNALRKY